MLLTLLVQAQDVVFTQPLSTLLYTNPAYSGASGNYRFGAAVRSQFTASANPYNTFYADFDLPAPAIQSGFGLYVMNDRSAVWQLISIALSYSYSFNVSENITIRPALQAVYYRQGQHSRSYIFPDAINGTGSTPVIYPASNEIWQGIDFVSGLLVSHPAWEAGLSVGHIGVDKNDSLMVYADRSLKTTLHGRGAIPLTGEATLKDPRLSDWNAFENSKVIPHLLISYQSNYKVFVCGMQAQAGALYADLNLKSDLTFEVLCVGLSVGLSSERFRMGYNIDLLTVGSQLSGWNSASHELFVHLGFGEISGKSMKSGKRWKKKSDCVGCPY